MKLRKIIKRVLIITVALIVIFIVGVYFYLQSFKPQYEGEVSIQGLTQDVEIYFDDYGIPHIYAQNEEDAYFAMGYVHAQERLFQMTLIKRAGSGRLAEIFGEEIVPVDRFFRTIGIRENAKISAQKYMSERKEPYQKAMWAYIDGVNAYIENGKMPLEFAILGLEREKFTPEDMYSLMGYMIYIVNIGLKTDPLLTRIHSKLGENYMKDLAIDWQEGTTKIPVYPELKRQSPDSTEKNEELAVTTSNLFDNLPVPMWTGSNSWVVAGKKTKSGKTFFANDTHLAFAQPSVWYETHLEYPGFSSYGNYVAGLPVAALGHTPHHAWGITLLLNDSDDLYQEKLNPDNPNQVKFKDTWEDMKIRQEVINIKGKEPLKFEVKTTRHGPIINDCAEDIQKMTQEPISYFLTQTQFPSQLPQAFYNFTKAKNTKEFEQACSLIHAPGYNIMYSDVEGNIAWWAVAKLIKRPQHVNSKLILNGYDGKDEPLGFYDFTENPKSINPPSGFITTANNQPDSVRGVLYTGYYAVEDRAKRITEILEKEDQWDTQKMQKMILDGISPNAPLLAKEIVKVLEEQGQNFNQNQKTGIELLKNWDGQHSLENIEPTIYYKLVYHMLAEAMLDELGKEDFRALLDLPIIEKSIPLLLENIQSPWWDNINTNKKENRQEIIFKAFEKTISEIEEQLGDNPNDWKWQEVHTITHAHPFGIQGGPLAWFFNIGPLPINGGNHVINNNYFHLNGEGEYPVLLGPAVRILIDYADAENSVSVLPTGQSGNVMSKHYDDQAQMFVDGKFRKQMRNETEIKEKSSKLLLKAN